MMYQMMVVKTEEVVSIFTYIAVLLYMCMYVYLISNLIDN